jgi:hypothetical protein
MSRSRLPVVAADQLSHYFQLERRTILGEESEEIVIGRSQLLSDRFGE